MNASFPSLESLNVQFEHHSWIGSSEDQKTNCLAIFRNGQKDTDQSCVIRHVDVDILVGLFPFLKVVNVSSIYLLYLLYTL